MKYKSLLSIALVAFVLLVSCSKSNEDDLDGNTGGNNPPATCVTTNMKYATDIAPIIQANCFSCHSNANMSISGISLEGHANLIKKVNDGALLGAINHAAGFTPMPQGGAKLSACIINKIKAWVDDGAQNN